MQRGHDPRDFTLVVVRRDRRHPRRAHGPGAPHTPGGHPAQRGGLLGRGPHHRRRPLRRAPLVRRAAFPGRPRTPAGHLRGDRPGGRGQDRGTRVRAEQIVLRYEIDMRYLGQAHEVPVEVPERAGRGDGRGDGRRLGRTLPREAPAPLRPRLPGVGGGVHDASVSAIGPLATSRSMPEIAAGGADRDCGLQGDPQGVFRGGRRTTSTAPPTSAPGWARAT